MSAPQLKIERRSVDELSKDPKNRRIHDRRNIETIKASLDDFDQQTPIVIDPSGKVTKGNGTLEAARQLGWKEIDVVVTKLKGRKQRRYAIADNRSSELARWDTEKLVGDLQQPNFSVPGFSSSEIATMAKKVSGSTKTGPPIPNQSDNVKTVQLTMTAPEFKQFSADVKTVAEGLDAESTTDAVLKALRQAASTN